MSLTFPPKSIALVSILRRLVFLFSCGVCLALLGIESSVPAFGADPVEGSNEWFWQQANLAYRTRQYDSGHQTLKELLEANPGDVELASKCLERILRESARGSVYSYYRHYNHTLKRSVGRAKVDSRYADRPWVQFAAQRICSLQRLGRLQMNPRIVEQAVEVSLNYDVRHGRALHAIELIDRFARDYPQDPFWRISQASVYRRIGSSKAQALYDRLFAEMDLDHPNSTVRRHWFDLSEDFAKDRSEMPLPIVPLPVGSPLPLMEVVDPDGPWGRVVATEANKIPQVIDRLAAVAMVDDDLMIWNDESGVTDRARALDLHLLSQPKADLAPLRKVQAARFSREEIPLLMTEAETLYFSRRYAWASPTQQRLLTLANRRLWTGRAQSALRSFQEVLSHATDERLRDAAQVGYWMARSQIGEVRNLDELLDGVKPDRIYTWLGKPTKAGTICERLIATQTPPQRPITPALKDLVQHVIHLPPISPWSSNIPAAVDLVADGQRLLVSGQNLLAMYDADNPAEPIWSNYQGQQQGRSSYVPGYFRPRFDTAVLYTRSGVDKLPDGIAAIDRSTGGLHWSTEKQRVDYLGRAISQVPLGDPVLADGLLYYLQWSTGHFSGRHQGRRLSIVCFDPRRLRRVWDGTIAISGLSTDLTASLARANVGLAMFGNRVTIHQGAIYSSTNCGMVVRSDVRDGRTDWIHHYRRGRQRVSSLNLGAPPVIAGDYVVFMPRDTSRIFALDRRTGRLAWENSLLQGVQLIGTSGDLLIIRGTAIVVALDLSTGETRWQRPLTESTLGRAQLIASTIYVAQANELLCLDAKTGYVRERRQWGLNSERPLSSTIHGRNLYVVTDKPTAGPGREVGRPLTGALPAEESPLAPTWTLRRAGAKVVMPSKGSQFPGTAYVLSEGILECLDMAGSGKIRWQRFVDTFDARLYFAGEKLLVLDRVGGRVAGVGTRVVAYDPADGRFLWEHRVVENVHDAINCGSCQLLYGGHGLFRAIDLSTGKRLWTRSLGPAHRIKFFWDEKHLHIFYITQFRRGCQASHWKVDVKNGRSILGGPIRYQVAKGNPLNVGNVKIDEIYLDAKTVYFKSHWRWNKDAHMFRYSLDGKPAPLARVLPGNFRFTYVKAPYYLANIKRDKQQVMVAHRFDNPAYQFDLGPANRFQPHEIDIRDDRLITTQRAVVVADLAKKQFIVALSDSKKTHNQHGLVLRQEPDILWKIAQPRGGRQSVFRFNLKTGQRNESVLAGRTEKIQIPNHRSTLQSQSYFDGTVLLNSGSAVTAWVVRD